MKTQHILPTFLFFAFSMLLFITTGCRKEVDVDIPIKERKLVVNAEIQADSLVSTYVYMSSHVQDEQVTAHPLKNAEVYLNKDGQRADTLNYINNGYYKSSNIIAQPNGQYEIEVSAPNLTPASGQTTVVNPVPIISFDSVMITRSSFDYEMVQLELTFKDEPGVDNYYRVAVLSSGYHEPYDPEINSGYAPEPYPVWVESNDPIIEAVSWYGNYLFFSDALMNGKEYKLQLQVDTYEYNSAEVLYVMLQSLSEEFYYYSKSVQQHLEASDFGIFAQAVIVYNNIHNGLGIVGSSAIAMDSIVNKGYNDKNVW